MENMERQLANLTGLVQKALTQTPTPRDYLQPPGKDNYRSGESLPNYSFRVSCVTAFVIVPCLSVGMYTSDSHK